MAGRDASQDKANSKSGRDELRHIVERIERLNADKAAIAEDIKDVFSEAKSRGYDTKVLRRVISERKRDQDEIAEEESVLELYREALGMGGSLSSQLDDNDADQDDDDGSMV